MSVPNIYLATCGKFHAFHLASEFAELGRLGTLYCADHHLSPPKNVRLIQYKNRIDLKLWRLGAHRLKLGLGHTFSAEASIFDRWLRCNMSTKRDGGVFHGWNGHISSTLRMLDPERWLRCVERSCPENFYQHKLLLNEAKELGVSYNYDIEHIEKSFTELQEADIIVAPSHYSASSYVDPALKKKVRINPLGANYAFKPKSRASVETPIVLSIGNSFLRKGFHYLIESLRQLPERRIELWIRGDIPSEYRKRIRDSRIRIIPPVSHSDLQKLFQRASLFCLPSIDEGFGMVTMEALAHGLPLIITEHVGAGDILSDNVAIRVPIRQSSAIALAVEQLLSWSPERYELFDLERRRILTNNSWRSCAARMLKEVYVRDVVGSLSP